MSQSFKIFKSSVISDKMLEVLIRNLEATHMDVFEIAEAQGLSFSLS